MDESEFDRIYNAGVLDGITVAYQIAADIGDSYDDSYDAQLVTADIKAALRQLKERKG